MSILIKGIEMPKDYKYVDVRIFRDGTATTASAEEPFYKKMDVIEVSTPHGDLIDRDELNKALIEMSKIEWNKGVSCSWAEAFEGVVDVVNLEIPIIEAEDGT